jgi:hypothetical protein
MPRMISAANVTPNFLHRRRLVAEDLRRLEDPCVIFEHKGVDSDGEPFYLYTVGGWLDGVRLPEGATVGGEVILVHGRSKEEADQIAALGLHDTILGLDQEEDYYQEANAALARLSSISPIERINQATKPDSDKSDAFVEDVAKVRPLVGDDVILAAGKVTEH